MCYKNARWVHLHEGQLRDFPRLTIEYLRDLTVGIFQVRLARSYIQDKMQRDAQEEFQLDSLFDEPGFIRVRVFSRFRNATKHQIFIAYNMRDEDDVDDEREVILGYYCTCRSGARTVGTCAHVASVLWYLGYARHQANVRYPFSSLLNKILDAAERPLQQDMNVEENE